MKALRLSRLLALVAGALALNAGQALAAGPPSVDSTFVSLVTASSARLNAEVTANGLATTVRAEYLTLTAYEANLAAGKDPFAGAAKAPIGAPVAIGSGTTPQKFLQAVSGLQAATAYRFRVVATNSAAAVEGPTRAFTTEGNAPVFGLPDGRGWEMVSPVDKNGGEIEGPEGILGGGAYQAAAQGGLVTYSSSSSFGIPQGFPGSSQYLAERTATGWMSENITLPLLSGGYDASAGAGVPYQVFSADLATGLLSNGKRCRGTGSACPVANPPLPGSGARSGYRNYYLRESSSGAATALLTDANAAGLALAPEDFEVAFAGATPDLSQVVLSSCAAITADATEAPGEGGCDPRSPASPTNLYRYAQGTLSLVNLKPGAATGTTGARLAAPSGAISANGARVYFALDGNLYLREGAQTVQVDESLGGGGTFETASADGSAAFFSKGGHLFRFLAATKAVTDLLPTGGLEGVLGASADGSRIYYLSSAGLFAWASGTTTEVASGADASNYPPATGTARVSTDGSELAFLASDPIGEYDSEGKTEVYLFSLAGGLACVSCNPTGERPRGPSSIPGAIRNGSAYQAYKPANLTAGGSRLYFDSFDALAAQDTNNDRDVYQWEADGVGTCTKAAGCIALISSGRAEGGAYFVDASADGDDVFFVTDESLVTTDPGSADLYDARVGGGFASPPVPIPCLGDSCQPIPGEPEDPAVGTQLSKSQGNPPLTFRKEGGKKKRKKGKKAKGKKKGAKAKAKKAKRGQGGIR